MDYARAEYVARTNREVAKMLRRIYEEYDALSDMEVELEHVTDPIRKRTLEYDYQDTLKIIADLEMLIQRAF